MITHIYLIKTQNSIYEIQVNDQGASRCRKNTERWRTVKSDNLEYLEKLHIGPSFNVPGVVLTSMVKDYQHFVPSGEPKRTITTIPKFFEDLTDELVNQVNGQAVRVVGENDEEAYS